MKKISDIRTRQRDHRDIVIIRLSRLGLPQEKIAQVVSTTQARVAQIINNTNFAEIYNLLSQGRDMDYIAEHYYLDLALAWALLGRKGRPGEVQLGWGLRT